MDEVLKKLDHIIALLEKTEQNTRPTITATVQPGWVFRSEPWEEDVVELWPPHDTTGTGGAPLRFERW